MVWASFRCILGYVFISIAMLLHRLAIPTEIIAVTEMWHPYISAVSLNDYDDIILRVRRNQKLGGGGALYVKKSKKYELHSELNSLSMETLEIIGIKLITKNNKKISIASKW